MTKQDDNAIKNHFLLMIIITTVFMLIFTYLGVLVHNQNTCDVQILGDKENKGTTNSTYILNHTGDFLLQRFTVNGTNNLEYTFCFKAIAESDDGLKVLIINENNEMIAQLYVRENKTRYCINIEKTEFKVDNLIGVNCQTCDDDNKIIIQQTLTGPNKEQIYHQNNTVKLYNDKEVNYSLTIKSGCRRLFTFFIKMYFWIMIILGTITLLIFGVKKLEKNLFTGW